jgi:hypothetical protein
MSRRIVNHYYMGKLIRSQRELEEAVANLPSLDVIKQTEPLNSIVSCKVYPSLALWVKSKGSSVYLRRLIEQAKLDEERSK